MITSDFYYTFTFTDANHVAGCFYLITPSGSTNLSKCYPMIGSRSGSQQMGAPQVVSSKASIMLLRQKTDAEELKREEIGRDTVPGFIEQGAVESYMSQLNEIK